MVSLKDDVMSHLKKQGFNCISKSKNAFPEIVAWRPFVNSGGDTLAINVQETLSGKIENKVVLPFYVSFIECKKDKNLNKKAKDVAKLFLQEGRCNTFLVAYKENKKLLFEEIKLNNKKPIKTKTIKTMPAYIG